MFTVPPECIPSFTGFYLVVSSFTWFYLVLLGFTVSLVPCYGVAGGVAGLNRVVASFDRPWLCCKRFLTR